jgi:hypothetical protein
MPTLIEIASALAQEKVVRASVEAICQATGDLLIGRSVYEHTNEVLLIVRLLHATSVSKLLIALREALQQELITSFECMSAELVSISFLPSLDLREQMHDFPLSPGESWFPALDNAHQAYVCLRGSWLEAEQTAWLLEHQALWEFV